MGFIPQAQTGAKTLNGGLLQMLVKKITIGADFDNSEQDSGWTIPTNAIIFDVMLNVTTADSSQTLDVGTDGSASNDPNGFLDGASVNATGFVKGSFVSTVGSNNTGGLVGAAATHTRGALLTELLIAGNDTAADSGDGVAVAGMDVTSGGDTLTYTGSDSTNTMRGEIIVFYALV